MPVEKCIFLLISPALRIDALANIAKAGPYGYVLFISQPDQRIVHGVLNGSVRAGAEKIVDHLLLLLGKRLPVDVVSTAKHSIRGLPEPAFIIRKLQFPKLLRNISLIHIRIFSPQCKDIREHFKARSAVPEVLERMRDVKDILVLAGEMKPVRIPLILHESFLHIFVVGIENRDHFRVEELPVHLEIIHRFLMVDIMVALPEELGAVTHRLHDAFHIIPAGLVHQNIAVCHLAKSRDRIGLRRIDSLNRAVPDSGLLERGQDLLEFLPLEDQSADSRVGDRLPLLRLIRRQCPERFRACKCVGRQSSHDVHPGELQDRLHVHLPDVFFIRLCTA